MSKFTKPFSSTLGKKLIMCLTGLFLCIFLIVHLVGNLQLFKADGGLAFNEYAYTMTHFTPIRVVSYLLYLTIIIHAVWALVVTIQNRKARPVPYAMKKGNGSIWSSRNMGILGTILLIFIVVHMQGFWWHYKFGSVPYVEYRTDLATQQTSVREMSESEYTNYIHYTTPKEEVIQTKDLYREAAQAFKEPLLVLFYLLSMAALSFHLVHGFQSAFQTLGWNNSKYRPIIKFIGLWFFSILIPIGFAAMPIYFFFK